MTTATAVLTSQETLEERMRMARTSTMKYDDGVGVTSSKDSRRLARAIENLVNRVIEDGLEGEDERAAFADFHNDILMDINRQIVAFAFKVENEIRFVRRVRRAQAVAE